MKRPEIGLEARSDGSFLDALVQLEKMRMPAADPNPNDIRPALPGKNPDANEGKEESFPLDGRQVFLERLFDIARDVAEKTEGQMHLLGRKPAHATHFGIEIRQESGNGLWRLDADEKPLRAHRRLAHSVPARDESASPPGGSTRKGFIA